MTRGPSHGGSEGGGICWAKRDFIMPNAPILRRARRDARFLLFTLVVPGLIHGAAVTLSPENGYGTNPKLPAPDKQILPTVDIADAKGWPSGKTPTPAEGLEVKAFATGLDHPRTVLVLPNGNVLVAETNAPKRPEAGKGIKGAAMKMMMKKAGAAVPSADRITLLRDADHDGLAEVRTVFLKNLTSPFGMALIGDTLYVANTDSLVKFPYEAGVTEITAAPQKVADLPAGPLNHHWTKSLAASRDGAKLFVGVGSNSNIAEHGMEKEENRAAVLEIDAKTGSTRVFASGLRNPAALAVHPATGVLWAAVNERDELGNNLVPDYLTSVKDGGFYGWPYSYFGANLDERVKPQRPELVAQAIVPDYALGSHTACLGIAFPADQTVPQKYRNGVIVGQHGSWNRKPPSGYQVLFVPFAEGRPAGMPEVILTGFLDGKGGAFGRPVGVAIDRRGGILVADDVGNVIWRVSAMR
jgi:glucose/arabinose dehydrogenase